MINEDIILKIEDDGIISIPDKLKSSIKENMLISFANKDTLIVFHEQDLNNLSKNKKLLKVIKANSSIFKCDENFNIKLPKYILNNIDFNIGKVVFSNNGNFKIINVELLREMDENYGKQI